MTENTRISLLYIGGAIVALVLISLYSRYQRQEIGELIKNDIGYTIGTFLSVIHGSNGRTSTTSIYIDFNAKAKQYKRMKIRGLRKGYEDAKKGDCFLVIYQNANPEYCTILFDYPIKDSTDFKRYLEEFKTKPLDIGKYF